MYRTTLIITMLLAGTAVAGTFNPTPYLADSQIDALTRQVANQTVDRDLFDSPYATVIVGNIDVYEHFPYLESRYFQVVSDPGWNRLVFGEMDKGLEAFDGSESSFGALRSPRGMSTDDQGRLYVADSGNDRVLVFQTVTEFDRITLVPVFAIDGLHQPHDVAFSDGGTPFVDDDDVLYVANTGRNEIRRYGLSKDGATLTSEIGQLGSGAGNFAGPLAIAVGRNEGSSTTDIYVADAHNGRLVQLRDKDGALQWTGELKHDNGVVTSLTSDHWGNIYAAGPESGIVKYTKGLKAQAGALPSANRARGFHVPTVTVTDHRQGTRQRSGEGRGVLVEQWDQGSGLRLMNLGVEIRNPAQASDGSASVDLFLTDNADLTATLRDPATGAVVATHRAGLFEAGAQRVALKSTDDTAGWDEGTYLLTIHAGSTYDPEVKAEAELTVHLSRSGDPNLPARLTAMGNYPNPFNPSTTIEFAVPAGSHSDFSLQIYDARGRLVRTLARGPIAPGVHQLVWDGLSDHGEPSGSGVYLYRVNLDDQKSIGKMTLLK